MKSFNPLTAFRYYDLPRTPTPCRGQPRSFNPLTAFQYYDKDVKLEIEVTLKAEFQPLSGLSVPRPSRLWVRHQLLPLFQSLNGL